MSDLLALSTAAFVEYRHGYASDFVRRDSIALS